MVLSDCSTWNSRISDDVSYVQQRKARNKEMKTRRVKQGEA